VELVKFYVVKPPGGVAVSVVYSCREEHVFGLAGAVASAENGYTKGCDLHFIPKTSGIYAVDEGMFRSLILEGM